MSRILVRSTLAAAAGLFLSPFYFGYHPVAAQTGTGAICISTYADANGNGVHESTESVLPGVNVNLSAQGVIIATHITTADEAQYCFENLSPGIYTLTFTDSPTYRAITPNEGTFELTGGQRLTIDGFGAAPIPPDSWQTEVAAKVAESQPADKPLELSVRLLLSTVASMVVMLFMIGIGAVIFGLIGGGHRQRTA